MQAHLLYYTPDYNPGCNLYCNSRKLEKIARHLRFNPTQAEKMLWHRIKDKQILGVKFFRQTPIGKFIVDFCAPSIKIIIELDGGQHFETSHIEQDKIRDAILRKFGYQILRFNNSEVFQATGAVLEKIFLVIQGVRGYQLSLNI